jgi:sigma-B regulation protein RsbQ
MSDNVLRRNNVHVQGRGTQPMLFAHGFGCDQNMWRFVTPAFENDYKVVLFDYVGSGRSDAKAYDPRRYASLDGYAQDILDVVHALDLRDVIVVGHSVSGMTAALAAMKEPDRFARIVMLGPSPCYINDGDYVGGFDRSDIDGLLDTMDRNYIGWANFLAPVVMKNPDQPELTTELVGSFCSTDPTIARRFAEATFLSDNRQDLGRIPTPSLIVQLTDDAIAPVSVGQYMHSRMPASTLKLFEGSGHCPHMTHPEETVDVIREYLGHAVSRAA